MNRQSSTHRILKTAAAASVVGVLTGLIPIRAETAAIYHFGIVPQQSATRLAKIWLPFLSELSARTGMTIKFTTTKDIPTFEKCLAQGAFQLAYMNPYHYTVFHEKAGYQAFARQSAKRLQGLMVVRADSPIKSLDQLSGQALAFPSPAAFGASVLPRAEMRERGLTFQPRYVKSHDSVYRSVAAGIFPAGGGVKRTFNNADEKIRAKLRIVYSTKKYTPHAFAAGPTVSADEIERVGGAMLKLAAEKPELVKALGMKGFQTAVDRDWNDVRALKLSANETQIVEQGKIKCLSD